MAMSGRPHAFSLRQAQYIVAVAETRGFGTAAAMCHVSQPSLSAQVGKVEETLGTLLFERLARGVQLTPAGHAVLPRFRALVHAADDVADTVRLLSDPSALTVRMGVIPTVAPYVLPRLADALRADPRCPTLHWIERRTETAEQSVLDGSMDAALTADAPSLPGLAGETVGFERFVVIVPTAHPLTGTVPRGALDSLPVLLLEEGHCLRDQAVELCLREAMVSSPYSATSLPTLVQMVASGLGVTVLPESAVPIETASGRLRAVPFDDPAIGRSLRLIWRVDSPIAPVLTPIRDALAQVLSTPTAASPR